MKRTVIGFTLGALLLALSLSAAAQQSPKVYRIGMLVSGSVATHSRRIDAFRQGLRELGYVEGKNIVMEYKYAEGKSERFADLAAAMVHLKPDVIFVASTGFTAAAKKATSTIPIVAVGGDLVGAGLVASLARPGGNVTGSTNISPDLSGKRLELLKEAVTKAARVAVLWGSGRDDEDEVKQTEIAARRLGVTIDPVPVRAPDEIVGAFAAMTRKNANALVIIQGTFTNSHTKQLAELAAKNRLPSIGEPPDWANNGGLMSYGSNNDDLWRRSALFVDKILKGRSPADLPVEQPLKFEFLVNLKTARQIGLTIPPNVLARADRVIK
jgi:putative tryptophan/tyrosine transport system substrate-binding protein